MKKVYKVYHIIQTEVHVDSQDYYDKTRPGHEYITNLKFMDEFPTLEEAEKYVFEAIEQDKEFFEYTILPTYTK